MALKRLKKKGGKKRRILKDDVKNKAGKEVKLKGKKGKDKSSKKPKKSAPVAQSAKSLKWHELMTGKADSETDTGRLGKLLERFKLVRNLANTNNYDYKEEEAEQVVQFLRDRVDELEADFDPDKKATTVELAVFEFE